MKYLCVFYTNDEYKDFTHIQVLDKEKDEVLREVERYNTNNVDRRVKVFDDELLVKFGEFYLEVVNGEESDEVLERAKELISDIEYKTDEIQRAINRFYEL